MHLSFRKLNRSLLRIEDCKHGIAKRQGTEFGPRIVSAADLIADSAVLEVVGVFREQEESGYYGKQKSEKKP